eukprot:TRINITY_DN23739_c0_g1_i1.p2 TRINITY_DN23739_c0_g1~~TRINITY_DN23739_c0_g1_i1.p2  ORF type:complete len:131 (-),score=63.33 TRINITY_DN23739_c0_g1_i1:162-554(-)
MIRRPPRSTQSRSSAASDVYKRQKYGLIQDRSNLQVAKDKLVEARQENEFRAPAPAKRYSSFDDNDDLHANFDDLMPESPDNFGGDFSANDFDTVNFDIPPNVDRTLFGDSGDEDAMLSLIHISEPTRPY